MSSPGDPGRPEQGWAAPSWGQLPEQPGGQSPAVPAWDPQPPGWAPTPGPADWAAPPTLVAPVQPARQPQAPRPPAAPLPVPPATVVVGAVLAVLGAVAAVLLALNAAADLLGAAGLRSNDADAVPALLAVPLVAALVGGAVAALAGRGGGLLRAGGLLLGVLAAAVAVGSGFVADVDGVRIGLAAGTAVVGVVLAVLAGLAPSQRWYRSAERRSAERVVARVLAGSVTRDRVTGVGAGWAVAAAVLALATVGAAALVLDGVSGDDDGGSEGGVFGGGPSSDGGPIPVDGSDSEYDPYLDALAEDCQDGDFDACDSLYWSTRSDSDYEAYALSCGGRTSEEYHGTCVEEFS